MISGFLHRLGSLVVDQRKLNLHLHFFSALVLEVEADIAFLGFVGRISIWPNVQLKLVAFLRLCDPKVEGGGFLAKGFCFLSDERDPLQEVGDEPVDLTLGLLRKER